MEDQERLKMLDQRMRGKETQKQSSILKFITNEGLQDLEEG